jgi:SAM-dependent methyltransferase
VRQHQREPFTAALQHAREAAYAPGEYVGQESFMMASEIRELAHRARIGPGVPVLDLCCGVAGPGRLIAAELGCRYLGLDRSASAVDIARRLAGDLPCQFEQVHLPPLPRDRFDVVLLLEAMLAFRDKGGLVDDVARVLETGGRFAFTLEEGPPLTATERASMPDADTVWLVEMPELTALLRDAGMTVTWQQECTASHHETAAALLRVFLDESAEIRPHIGARACDELIGAHRLWCDWFSRGRVRKFALVAEKLVGEPR